MPTQYQKTNGRQTIRDALVNPHSFALTLITCVTDLYPPLSEQEEPQAWGWDPITLTMQLEDDLAIDIPRGNIDRLNTAIEILKTDVFWNQTPDFVRICNILSGSPLIRDTWDPADSAEIAWGVTEASLLDPQDAEGSDAFAPEIVGYIVETLRAEGMMHPPSVLGGIVPAGKLNTHGTFSDDPAMYAAISDSEAGKTEDVNQFVSNNLKELLTQLNRLKLEHGDAAHAVQQLISGTRSDG